MAEEIRKVIHIDTSRSATSVKDLRDEIKSLRDALVQLDSTSEQYVQIAQQVAQREQKLAQVMSASKNVITPYQRSLNALTATYSNQRQELRALRTALENLDPATAEYRSAFERAAEITHDLQERQELLRRSSSDLGVQLGNMRDIGTGLAAGWSSVNALMTLTGNNSEDLQKAMVKLQAGIALVQGMKGLEGLKNAVKGYINGAAKWFDNIVELGKGQKTLAAETDKTTTATKASSAAASANATALEAEGTGAEMAGAGMKSAAAGTTVFAGALKVLKAAIISTGIGALIVLLGSLISKLTEFESKGSKAYKNAKTSADVYFDSEKQHLEDLRTQYERDIERLEAQGKSEEKIFKRRQKYFYDLGEALGSLTEEEEAYKKILADAESKWGERDTSNKRNWGWGANKNKKITANLFGFSDADMANIRYVEKKIQEVSYISKESWKGLSNEAKKAYDRIKADGIKTYQDLMQTKELFNKLVVNDEKKGYEDEVKAEEHELKVRYDQTVKNAADRVRTEIGALKDEKQRELDIVGKNATARTNIEKYYNKQIWSIVTSNTQSIIDNAKSTNNTELENLKDKYDKEIKELKKYGRLTAEIQAEMDKAYEKNRAAIMDKNVTDTINKTMTAWKLQVNGLKQGANLEKDMLAIQGKPSADAVQKYNDLIYSYDVQLAEDEKKLWEEVAKSDGISPEKRVEAEQKVAELTIKLQDLATEKIINDAKTRKDKVQEEIDELNLELDKMEAKASKNLFESQTGYTMSHTNNASGAGSGILEAVWGGKNASYKQMQEQMDTENAIITAGLEARIAALKKFKAENELTKDQMLAYDQQIASLETELNKQVADNQIQTAELTQEKWETFLDAGLSVMDSFADILGSVADTMEAQVQRQLELGQITEEQAEEQRKKIKAIQIAQTIVSTISGAIGAFTQASATIPPPAGQIVGGAAAAAVIAAGIASIAQMKSTEKNTNSISNSLPIASPSLSGFEKDYEANMTGNSEVSALRNAIEGADIRAYVVESDITSAQNRSRRRSSESTF